MDDLMKGLMVAGAAMRGFQISERDLQELDAMHPHMKPIPSLQEIFDAALGLPPDPPQDQRQGQPPQS